MASIFGLVVGSSKHLANLFIPQKAPFHAVFEAMRTLSAGYLPAVLLVLSGSLMGSSSKGGDDSSESTNQVKTSKRAFFKQISAVYVCRFLILPVLVFSLIKLLRTQGPFKAILDNDSLLVFILLLESCMPSAQNSTVILQLEKDRAGAARMARILLAIYVLGIPAITFWLVNALKYSNLLS